MAGGRPQGSENRDKPFREALRLELAAMGDDLKGLRMIAKQLIGNATEGKLDSIKEIADRLDGKPMQATEVTGKDGGPITTQEISDTESARRVAFLLAKAIQPGS